MAEEELVRLQALVDDWCEQLAVDDLQGGTFNDGASAAYRRVLNDLVEEFPQLVLKFPWPTDVTLPS